MDSYNTVAGFFQSVGLFMYSNMAVLVIGMAIAIERYIHLCQEKVRSLQLWNKIMPLLKEGKYRLVAADIADSIQPSATSSAMDSAAHVYHDGVTTSRQPWKKV